MAFQYGQIVNFIETLNGEEKIAKVVGSAGQSSSGESLLFLQSLAGGESFPMEVKRVFRVRGPYFKIRGLVFTASLSHPNEEGEIIALGENGLKATAYQVRFKDNSVQWFNADQVFIRKNSADEQ